MALIYRNNVLKIITCQSIGRVAKMNGISCTSIAMMEWGDLNVIIDVLTGCTLIILYACHDNYDSVIALLYRRYLNSVNA